MTQRVCASLSDEARAALEAAHRYADQARVFSLPVSAHDLRLIEDALRLAARHASAHVRASRRPVRDGVGGWDGHLKRKLREGVAALELLQRMRDASFVRRRSYALPPPEEILVDAPPVGLLDQPRVDWDLAPTTSHWQDGRVTEGASWSLNVRKWNSQLRQRVDGGHLDVEDDGGTPAVCLVRSVPP